MDINELVPGKLYKAPYKNTWFIFVSKHKSSNHHIVGHYFCDNKLVGAHYTIGNSSFWNGGIEASFDEVKDWMPEEFMPKEQEINYQIY